MSDCKLDEDARINKITLEQMSKHEIKSDKYINVRSISKCLQYVGGSSPPDFDEDYFTNVETFMEMIKELKVNINYVGNDLYFDEDRDYRDIYNITVKRKSKDAKISFRFGTSLMMTWNHEKPDLYDILTSISCDYSLGAEGYEEYCANFDISDDSIKGLKRWKKIEERYEKLQSMFDESEIWSLPM